MSRRIPSGRAERVAFFTDHINVWNDNAAALGLTPERIAAFLTARINPATEALENARQARNAAKAATVAADVAIQAMLEEGRAIISTIRSVASETAAAGGNPDTVWQLAQLDPDTPPSPRPVPLTPTDLSATISPAGVVELRFEAPIDGRQWFEIERSVAAPGGAQGPSTLIASVAETLFTDTGVPAGTAIAAYRVRAKSPRGASGWSAAIQVAFAPVAQQPEQQGLRLKDAA